MEGEEEAAHADVLVEALASQSYKHGRPRTSGTYRREVDVGHRMLRSDGQ